MKFFTVFVTGLSLISSIAAAPTPAALPNDSVSELEVRANKCPTVTQIRAWLKENTKVGDKTVFYTNGGGADNAGRYAKQIGGQYYDGVYSKNQLAKWENTCGTDKEKPNLQRRMSEALARESTGHAYLMLPKGKKPLHTSVWMKQEYPRLKDNKVSVTVVNPSDFSQTAAWNPDAKWKRSLGLQDSRL